MTSDAVLVVVLLAAGALAVFFVLREFWTWYWKQSQQLEVLKSIDASLKTLAALGAPLPAAPVRAGAPGVPMASAPLGSVPTSVRP